MKYSKLLTLVIIAGLLTAGVVIVLVSRDSQNTNQPQSDKTKSGQTSSAAEPNTASQLPGPLVTSPKITISSPKKGETLKSGSTVSGTVASPDGQLHILVKGTQSGVLADYSVNVTPSGTNQPFSFTIELEKNPKTGETGYLELYTMQNGLKVEASDLEVKLE